MKQVLNLKCNIEVIQTKFCLRTNPIHQFQLYFFSLNQLTTIFGGICGLYSMFKTDGTIDKIFTGGAGKNGATVAVSPLIHS